MEYITLNIINVKISLFVMLSTLNFVYIFLEILEVTRDTYASGAAGES